MKILITGASGYLGSHLVPFLENCGHTTLPVVRHGDKKYVRAIYYDGSTQSLSEGIENFMPDLVIHLATLYRKTHAKEDIEGLISSNVTYGAHLLEAMRLCNISRIINTGTAWKYDQENHISPVNFYAATKVSFDTILDFYVKKYNLRSITLNFNDTYGGVDRRSKLVRMLFQALTSGMPLEMSSGIQLIDILHIEDVLEAYKISIKNFNEITSSMNSNYGIHSHELVSLRRLVEIVEEIVGKKLDVKWGTRPDIDEVIAPSILSDILPGWSQKLSLQEGLAKAYTSFLADPSR
jgi:nucleoside-diphosphate-sugar epimerase